MADGSVTERTPEEWQTLLTKMFPQGVRVTGAGADTPQYVARSVRVFHDPDSGNNTWVLGISESHAEYLSLTDAEVLGETLRVKAFGGTAIVRPYERT